MRWQTVVVSDNSIPPLKVAGTVAECPDCHRREWWVFRLDGSNVPCVQCCHCDRVETVDGRPLPELEVYALVQRADDGPLHPMEMPGKAVGQ